MAEKEQKALLVVNLDEIASRWQIPVETIKDFIVNQDMPLEEQALGCWFVAHSDLILKEKQKAFEKLVFPWPLRPKPTKSPA